jgi:hypothetical protein
MQRFCHDVDDGRLSANVRRVSRTKLPERITTIEESDSGRPFAVVWPQGVGLLVAIPGGGKKIDTLWKSR